MERVETVPYALPFTRPYTTARGTIERREMVLLRLHTDAGIVGLGEAVPLSLRGDRSLAEVEAAILDDSARLAGLDLGPAADDPLGFAVATLIELAASSRTPPAASAALECAVFDLVAKGTDQPMWRLLGASGPAPVACNATLTAGTAGEVAGQATAWAAEGYRAFKLKLGGTDDLAVVAAVREAVGETGTIRVDANEAWSVREAIAVLGELEPCRVELAEQPVAGLRAMAKVARDVAIPLAADESVRSEADAHRAVQRRSCSYAAAKLSKVGGIGPTRQIAKVLPTYLTSALDGPVGIAAAAHAVQVLRDDGQDPGLAHGLATQRLFGETVASHECELVGAELRLPPGPGLGVELDETELERHRIVPG